MTDSRHNLGEDVVVPEPDKDLDLPVFSYCCEAAVFALKKLPWWEDRASWLELDWHERLVGLWKEASSTLGRLAGLVERIDPFEITSSMYDGTTLDAAITAADSTLDILAQLCDAAAELTVALAKAGPGPCNFDMVDDCSRLTAKDLAELVKITVKLRTLRSEFSDPSGQCAVEGVAAA